jgi:hypothetical protein
VRHEHLDGSRCECSARVFGSSVVGLKGKSSSIWSKCSSEGGVGSIPLAGAPASGSGDMEQRMVWSRSYIEKIIDN